MSQEIVEESGLSALPELLRRQGCRRVFLISGPSRRHVERASRLLAGFELEVFAGARRHVPEAVLADAERAFEAFAPDALVALGGGSAIGVGKGLRLAHDAYFIAVPTTYSGSERTSLYGITRGGHKQTGRDERVRPDAVIYDVELSAEFSKAATAASLMNALAHPLGALEADDEAGKHERALTAIDVVYTALEALVAAPRSTRARRDALRGAGLAAAALEAGAFGAHHPLVHRLGGRFDLEHAGLHAVLLPHSVHRLRATAPASVRAVEERLRLPDLEGSLFDLLLRSGAALSLAALGVSSADFFAFLEAEPALPRQLLAAAFHGRRPSATTRLEDWGLAEPVSCQGPELETARRVVVVVHEHQANADQALRRIGELAGGDPTLSVVAPQARDNVWSRSENDGSAAALAEIEAVLRRVAAKVGLGRVVLFGFGEGASLLLRITPAFGERPAAFVALGGAPGSDTTTAGSALDGVPTLLSGSDPARPLGERDRLLARELVHGERAPEGPSGFGNEHSCEALAGALPQNQNSPRHGPYGLYPEQVSGTGFVARRGESQRSWLYRIRPAAQQGPLAPLPHAGLHGVFSDEAPEPNLIGFRPLAIPDEPADFLDGLVTVGGAGSPRLRRGYAVHVYAANQSMEDRAFYDADGDLLLLPELGRITLLTELGLLDVAPGEIAIVPRGLRFSVVLREAAARGFVAEVFGRHFALPERGALGANGLAEARHFRAPSASFEDRLAPGYRIAAKLGGRLYEATNDYCPYDVAAWHGNYCPYAYDLSLFSPAGNTRIDHADPSIHTVLSAPLDEQGSHTLDLVLFTPRWDVAEHTFRPPYFHRNATTEFNGVLRDPGRADSPFVAGSYFLTPSMTPHGALSASVEHALAQNDEVANGPRRSSQGTLWFQFETALPFCLSPAARSAPNRIPDWHAVWGAYRSHFSSRL